MFLEKESVKEQFSSVKDANSHSYLLITSVFDNYKQLSKNEFIILSIKWKKKVKESVHINDFGYVLNGGNIFVIVDNSRKTELITSISEILFTKQNKSSIYSDVLELSQYELLPLMK